MALTLEWQRRIDNWRRELPNHLYLELSEVPLVGFITQEQLTVQEAIAREMTPMPAGTPWGAKWDYAWFRGRVTLSPEARGQRIALRPEVGGEAAVYLNGVAAGGCDSEHREITLARDSDGDEQYDVMIEAYAGHGPRVHYAGPTPPGRETVPEPGATQVVMGRTTYGVWQEDVFQLLMDVETLYGVRNEIDPESLRVMEIDAGLRDFAIIVDFELPREEMLATVRACRERLRPLLERVNGPTTPTLYAFGHSHIDVAWLWPLAETERKCVRTFSTQLALMDEYPEFRFLQSQPHLFRMVQRRDPDVYRRMKAAAKEGQLIADGGMWVEADTNISSGESLIRQFIHGKRFFRDEFGADCELLWLPDVFGYSGALPQIMRGCGVKYFSTAKIFWAYNGGDPFPYNTFTWEGIDGSSVLVHLTNDYNSRTDPASLIERWNGRVQKDGFSKRLVPFGYGDGGGGPTRWHLEFLRRMVDLEGVPRTKIAAPVQYFYDQEAEGVPDARYVGELYFQAHRGTYTSQAKTKRGNRKGELALREAELWGVVARALKGYDFASTTLDEEWKTVLLNQFHDIIPGSSITRVYEEAEAAYDGVIDSATRVRKEALQAMAHESSALSLHNSLSWARTALVPLPEGARAARDSDGALLPAQVVGNNTWVEATVPSCGWTSLRLEAQEEPYQGAGVTVGERVLENELLRLEFNDKGEISSIFDKTLFRELAAGPCNSMHMYKDVPTNWDAWDLDSIYPLTPVPLEELATFEIVTSGPLVGTLRTRRRLHNSLMTQEISLRRNSHRVDFATTIDWQESHKLLKVCFPVNYHTNEGVHEIQFGHIRRPNHASRPFDADRFEVSNHKWSALMEENRGFAVLNDCKYGINIAGNSINLTLLKSALAPDMYADKGRQEFTYALYPWEGSFADSDVVCSAYDLNCPIVTSPGDAGQGSFLSVDAPNIIIETVKPAEDGSDDVIVRLYEAKRTTTRCQLATMLPIVRALETDMLEENGKALLVEHEWLPLEFRPFEVKTIRLTLEQGR